MRSPFTPPRRRTAPEVLDDPACDPGLRERSLRDVARANRLLGGRRAVRSEVRRALRTFRGEVGELTLLDVGTGLGDIPRALRALSRAEGVALRLVGLDAAASLAAAARPALDDSVCGDALALPFASRSVDIVTCSQVLHHFDEAGARALLREMHRVARRRVIVSDLRRSRLAAAGLWLVSRPMGFHPVSRADGILSILKGFRATELRTLVREAVGAEATVRRRLGFRLTATWAVADTPAVAEG